MICHWLLAPPLSCQTPFTGVQTLPCRMGAWMTIAAGTSKRHETATTYGTVSHITFLITFCWLKDSTVVAMKCSRNFIFWVTVTLQGNSQERRKMERKISHSWIDWVNVGRLKDMIKEEMECKSIALRIMNIICLTSIMFYFLERGTLCEMLHPSTARTLWENRSDYNLNLIIKTYLYCHNSWIVVAQEQRKSWTCRLSSSVEGSMISLFLFTEYWFIFSDLSTSNFLRMKLTDQERWLRTCLFATFSQMVFWRT